MFFLSGGVGGVDAFEEKVMVPMDNSVLKVVEHGRYGGEAVLPKAMLKVFDVILAGRKGFTNIDGEGVVFHE